MRGYERWAYHSTPHFLIIFECSARLSFSQDQWVTNVRWCCLWTTPALSCRRDSVSALIKLRRLLESVSGLDYAHPRVVARAMVHWEIGFTSCEQDTSKWILTLQKRCGLLPSCSTEIDDNRCVMCVCVCLCDSPSMCSDLGFGSTVLNCTNLWSYSSYMALWRIGGFQWISAKLCT